ncbi:carbohydrate ABC transporter permease [Jiangella alkaliphila]|uniref:Carbohydrate ABC transporter membrane protein 2, CUT1 family n=1 Tax=Jiangella alkaliphila TaxID=419479 RepID=A0A1H2LG10_9ACTN|nr:carbohydrate ABC transporter permease [Jiangella alkaliphila]SDU79346.1 carbohydrate ABC transporter membrane protein 2, CUT1 family [Jiangella alkaliphila]
MTATSPLTHLPYRARVARRGRRVLLGAFAILIGLFSVFPFYWMILTSLKPETEIFTVTPQFWTSNPTLERYETLLRGAIGEQFLNSFIIAIGATFLATFCGMLAAYALSRFHVPAKTTITVALLVVQLLPAIVVVIPLYAVYREIGLLNTYSGVIIAHTALALALAVWLIRGFLAGIPISLDEAAMVDGANRAQILYHIIVPLALPGIAVSAIYAFITSWNELLLAMTFLQDESMKTLPGALQQFSSQYGTDWGGIMTASTIFAIPVMIFFIIVRRYIASGATVGAIKG